MATVDDRIVLASWNGRPTVSVDVVDGQPLLHWLLVGHVEDFDIWMHVTLTWEQADGLSRSAPGGFDLGSYLASVGDIPASFTMSFGERQVAEGTTTLKAGKNNVRDTMRDFIRQVHDAWDTDATPDGVAGELHALSA